MKDNSKYRKLSTPSRPNTTHRVGGRERESYFQLLCVNLFRFFKYSNLHAVLIKPLDRDFNSAALAIRRPDETLEDAPESAFSDLQLRSKLRGRFRELSQIWYSEISSFPWSVRRNGPLYLEGEKNQK